MKQLQISLPSGNKLTPLGIETRDNSIDFRTWKRVLGDLCKVQGAVLWCIGDWLNYGEQREWGDRYTEACRETGYGIDTLKQAKWVAKHVAMCDRSHNLSFSHHIQVAKLIPDEQRQWLKLAEKKGWTRKQLREQIRSDYPQDPDSDAAADEITDDHPDLRASALLSIESKVERGLRELWLRLADEDERAAFRSAMQRFLQEIE